MYMSEEDYYNDRADRWLCPDAEQYPQPTMKELICQLAHSMAREESGDCACHGGGWILTDYDTWHQCPFHYSNQTHPEDFGYE